MTETTETYTTPRATYTLRSDGRGWSYVDSQGRGRTGSVYETPAEAQSVIDAYEVVDAAAARYSGPLSRAAYEAACAAEGVAAQAETDVRRYGDGDFWPPVYTASQVIAHHLAAQRAMGQWEERPAHVATARTLVPSQYAPAGTTEAHAASGTGPCVTCHAPYSAWNSGAGSYRCPRHWDAY